MIIKVLSTSNYDHVRRALFDQWHMQRSFVRMCSIQVINRPGDIGCFENLVSGLRFSRGLAQCARSFGVPTELPDLDISVIQEAINTAGEHFRLHKYIVDALAFSCELMDDRQLNWFGFDRWYAELMEIAIFGTAEDPIVVED
ncbi:hypothetical protein BYT27DRAFT_7207259 [Phlegmacium glaucopus]|nr:hypothetical protein BYT27DRAFT_7209409 [Phlegmacium glaucopus]KAF8813048.1 hypothetical protein BYT27DRAFT_7207259 [Phlegmacium glaucopus]